MSERVAIRTDRLTRAYGPQLAVNEISFEVPRGQVLGFLGPNGAGKSTTMKMLTCYLTPTRGSAQVAGFDVYSQSLEVRRRIGLAAQDAGKDRLPGGNKRDEAEKRRAIAHHIRHARQNARRKYQNLRDDPGQNRGRGGAHPDQ